MMQHGHEQHRKLLTAANDTLDILPVDMVMHRRSDHALLLCSYRDSRAIEGVSSVTGSPFDLSLGLANFLGSQKRRRRC